MIESRVIDSLDEFLRLGPAWDELLASTPLDHAFMRHVWFTEWIRAYGCEDQLAVATTWSDKQLVAAAPVRRTRFRFRGVKSNGLSFLWSPVAPRCNVLSVDGKYTENLAKQLFRLPDWDIFVAKNMESDLEVTGSFIESLCRHRSETLLQIEDGLKSPYLLTEGSFEDYWSSLPKKRRKHLTRMCMKRLEKAGDYKISKVATSAEFQKFMPALFEISARSWKSFGDDHLKRDAPEGRFYACFTPVGIDHGLVTLYTIEIKGKIVGFEYLLTCNDRYSLIRCDYDEDFKYFAPGNNLRLAILRDLFSRDGVCEYDLGGDAYPYKLEWCDSIRRHTTITVAGDSLRGRAILLAKNKIMPSLRRMGIEIPRVKNRK